MDLSEFVTEPERRTPVIAKYDVVVAGGGPAGFGAAVAAARNGAKTLLIERYGFLGGGLTAQYVYRVHCDKMVPLKEYGEEKPLLGGIVTDLTEKLVGMKGSIPPTIWEKYDPFPNPYYPIDPEITKIGMMEMIEDAGVKQLLHAIAVDAVVEGNEVKGVIIESKSGRQAVMADVVIDCTGDGDVAVAAGCEFEKATGRLLPMSMVVILGGVDTEINKKITGADLQKIVKKAREFGLPDYPEFDKREGRGSLPETPDTYKQPPITVHRTYEMLPPDLLKKYWLRRNESWTWPANYFGDCSNVEDLTKAEIWTRKQILPMLEFYRKHVPGHENCYVMATAPQIGLRESRRILGEYVLTWDFDVVKQRRHNDVVCQARPPYGPAFDVPYRCVVPREIDGILTAGRCISVDHGIGRMVAIRDELQCMAIGQASGTAAALAVRDKVKPREIDVPTLQDTLKAQRVNLGN